LEGLFIPDWTLDPSVQPYQLSFLPNDQEKGGLAGSWEFTDSSTLVIHVRQGIHWQNIPPANGRELIANDIVFHFDRMIGLGDGFTQPAPYWNTVSWTKSVTSVTAVDKYTVVMKWNTPNPEFIMENLEAPSVSTVIENPEAVQQWGNLNDWHHALGTGPFILTDYVSGSSSSMVKNPNYWGHDERYPQNSLPYVDKITYLVIPDNSTALAAMRTGKIDILDGLSTVQDAKSMQKTNPEIKQILTPSSNGLTLDPRNDKAPFNDIRVREALQMAIDLPTITSTYYSGTCSPDPLSLTSDYLKGWGYPYTQWPQDLKDQYAYNPTAAKQLLANAGFPNGFKTDLVVDSVVDTNLVQIVKSYFTQINVDMDIRPMDTASFTALINSHKNDALLMRTAGSLGVSYYPLRQFTKFQTGASANYPVVSDPAFDAYYTKSLTATTTDEVKSLLMDCNEYVVKQHYVISLIQPMAFNLCQPWLNGFNAQYGSMTGVVQPQLVFFYEARFWIDQNQKNNLKH